MLAKSLFVWSFGFKDAKKSYDPISTSKGHLPSSFFVQLQGTRFCPGYVLFWRGTGLNISNVSKGAVHRATDIFYMKEFSEVSTTMIVFTSSKILCHYVFYSSSKTLVYRKNKFLVKSLQYPWIQMYLSKYKDMFP